MQPLRRRMLGLIAAAPIAPIALAAPADAAVAYPVVRPQKLRFPEDHGAHPAHRIEWWYLTGWLEAAGLAPFGFQLTFFQIRPGIAEANPSRFAADHLLVAHAALAWPPAGHLLHAARTARSMRGLVGASEGDCDVRLDRWRLWRQADDFKADVDAGEFMLQLAFGPTSEPLLHGEGGYSQKAPGAEHASQYVSLPQLPVRGRVRVGETVLAVSGKAWFDHEWSSSLMHPDAAGWDWAGINLHDGSALMLFRMRRHDGGALWHGGTLRRADGTIQHFDPSDIAWQVQREWRSPRSGVRWPVSQTVRFADRIVSLAPLMDDQELDTRSTTGAIYWEGAVRAMELGREVGRGYLELTGYDKALRL